MKLPSTAHTSRPWRIHDITRDFRLEDVWALPTPGGPDDFSRLVQQFAEGDSSDNPSWVVHALFAIRRRLGALFNWDEPKSGIGSRVSSLRDRLPGDLCEGSTGPQFTSRPLTSVYLTHDEWAAEVSNRTVHAVMHMGWVPDEAGGYRGQLAVLVKPNGLFGRAYMAAIAPFRHLLVYPSLMRSMGRQWREGMSEEPVDPAPTNHPTDPS
ncbi:MAG TPA: DUF2867 domain-containing protein [Propionibacteriaceae bacterium]|nr:DUF2867 domain-containing protein [Propionibacteriaceae bacterium]